MAFESAQRALFTRYAIETTERRVRLADPALDVHVLEAGEGEPLLLIHGSGMSGATWAPLLPHLPGRRVIAVSLPGFGLSDPYVYTRPLRAEAVAQMTSIVDALELERSQVAGTSLGGMWALNLALAAPHRVRSAVSVGMPAVSLPGVKADPFFRLMTTPLIKEVVSRVPPPKNAATGMKGVIGKPAIERTPKEWFDIVAAGMRTPGWAPAMKSHLNLALSWGRARPGNAFTEDELRRLDVPVLFIWGDVDRYGGPEIGRHAAALMPGARVEVIPGNHAPFLDDPERCARLIDAA